MNKRESNLEAQRRYRERLKNRTDEEIQAVQDSKPFKKCTTCKETLPSRENFSTLKSRPDGFHSECSKCASSRSRRWIEDNRDRFNEYQREYYHRVKKHKKS